MLSLRGGGKMIILINGKQGAGKTTVSALLEKRYSEKAKVFKFAKTIYEISDSVESIFAKKGIALSKNQLASLKQIVGTEWGRNKISENIWADLTKNEVNAFLKEYPDSIAIIDDLRFPNEIDVFKDQVVVKIRLDAPEEIRKQRAEKWREDVNHLSEVALDDYDDFDYRFDTYKMTAEEVCDLIYSVT